MNSITLFNLFIFTLLTIISCGLYWHSITKQKLLFTVLPNNQGGIYAYLIIILYQTFATSVAFTPITVLFYTFFKLIKGSTLLSSLIFCSDRYLAVLSYFKKIQIENLFNCCEQINPIITLLSLIVKIVISILFSYGFWGILVYVTYFKYSEKLYTRLIMKFGNVESYMHHVFCTYTGAIITLLIFLGLCVIL